jgi:DMSO/TMAO reductase YedYZ molybdopterin-dependent catalytic subunit
MTGDDVTDQPPDPGGATPPSTSADTGGGRLAELEPSVRAVAAAVAALAASYAVAGTSPSFVGAPIAALVVAATPDVVVQYSITLLGDAGKLLGLATALVLTACLLAAAARLGPRLAGDYPGGDGLLSGLVVATVAAAITGAPVASVAAGAAAAVVVAAPHAVPERRRDPDGRRELLAAVGTALGAGMLGVAAGATRTGDGGGAAPGDETNPESEVGQKLAMAEDRSLDVDGLEGLVSSSFYTVDIAQFDPKVDTSDWELSVTGAVESEQTYDFDDVREREWDHRFETLRCVGEDLNGHKCDNALWTGIPIWDLVEAADPQGEHVMLRAEDDFFEEFPLAAMEDGMLAVAMNGEPLPREHGAPARALIPGHWGEINVKWINEIEVLDQEMDGYWENRGWHGTGPVNTVAKLWVVNHLDDGRVAVAGHAYAGTRGVDRVEVSTDGGDTWTDAELSEELPGDDVWRQWAHRYDPPDAGHEVVVRAVDGDGNLQPQERSGAFPSGPTGWVSKTVQP